MEIEEWRTIRGYEGKYEISSLGNVCSLPRDYKYGKISKRKFLHQSVDRGYLRVTLFSKGKRKKAQVHRLVAEAFIPNVENKPFINHLDENKRNNIVSNLAWCTAKENDNYGNRNLKVSKSVSKAVLQLSMDEKIIKRWNSMTQASRETGACLSEISKCTRSHNLSAGGYKWRLTDDME
jgi:hypothetical protein